MGAGRINLLLSKLLKKKFIPYGNQPIDKEHILRAFEIYL
jgi:hypothetical protein